MNVVAIVLARGGSKGIPHKNLMNFCGKPLLQWTLEQLLCSFMVHHIYVSSDDSDILDLAWRMGVQCIERPDHLCTDEATSESGWIHALESATEYEPVDMILAPQPTSPIRRSGTFGDAIRYAMDHRYDSLFSASPAKDLCLWYNTTDQMKGISYDPASMERRRQTMPEMWIENGSFYVFTPEILRKRGLRFGENPGIYRMRPWEMFEIDEPDDIPICEVIMQAMLEGRLR